MEYGWLTFKTHLTILILWGVNMLDIPSVSAILAAAGVILGVAFTMFELRHLVKTRQTDLVMRLATAWTTKEFVEAVLKFSNLKFEDYNDFVKTYGPPLSDTPVHAAFYLLTNYFEQVGTLLHLKLVDVDTVSHLLPVSSIWTKAKPIVEGHRKDGFAPTYLEWFEYLHNETQKRSQQPAKIK
jgi:hypothetical protein